MEQLNSEEQVIIEEFIYSEHTEIHLIEYLSYPFYLSLLCLLCLLINLNKLKFKRRIQIVGVTGGIGCGKSTITKYFNEFLKLQVIDCDQIARDILEPGKPAYKLIVQRFGRSILAGSKLADVVFQVNQKRKQLQSITNKYIFIEIVKSIWKICFIQKEQYVVVDDPLLFESKGQSIFVSQQLLLLSLVKKKLLKGDSNFLYSRVKDRSGLTEKQIIKKIGSQMKLETKIKKSDIVIKK